MAMTGWGRFSSGDRRGMWDGLNGLKDSPEQTNDYVGWKDAYMLLVGVPKRFADFELSFLLDEPGNQDRQRAPWTR